MGTRRAGWPSKTLISTTYQSAMVAVRQKEQNLMTQHLDLTVSEAVLSQDFSLNRRICKASLKRLFGRSRVELHNNHWRSEIVRILAFCTEMSRTNLKRLVFICVSDSIDTQSYTHALT